MNTLFAFSELIFWILTALVILTYFGYGLIVWVMVKIKEVFYPFHLPEETKNLPVVTILVAAFNEAYVIAEKMDNIRNIDYPKEKLKIVFVTDGSTDETPALLKSYPEVSLFHDPERKGKIAAINRVIPFITGDVVVFSDANSMFNPESILKMVRHFSNPKVGAVAGEKRVKNASGDASAQGEGLYWKYESLLKSLDSRLYSAVGAAGEIWAIRRSLLVAQPSDSIIEDFIASVELVLKGYRVVYEKDAWSLEEASVSVKEEMKRKIRISAGGFQSIIRLKKVFNIFKYPVFSFQFLLHRAFRWAVVPFCLPLLLLLNGFLAFFSPAYLVLFGLHLGFHLAAWIGYRFELAGRKQKILSIFYFFDAANLAAILGFIRFLKGNQTTTWEKALRKT
ncbi:MAG: glycosyltransferase family 2 protein [Bacteroidetes bacterium]|nr:glycosyltransferase family 2 protein [Bacteroidota bacterium]